MHVYWPHTQAVEPYLVLECTVTEEEAYAAYHYSIKSTLNLSADTSPPQANPQPFQQSLHHAFHFFKKHFLSLWGRLHFVEKLPDKSSLVLSNASPLWASPVIRTFKVIGTGIIFGAIKYSVSFIHFSGRERDPHGEREGRQGVEKHPVYLAISACDSEDKCDINISYCYSFKQPAQGCESMWARRAVVNDSLYHVQCNVSYVYASLHWMPLLSLCVCVFLG